MKNRINQKIIRQFLIITVLLTISFITTYVLINKKINNKFIIDNSLNNMDHYFKIKSIFNKKLLINYALGINSDDYEPEMTNLGNYIEDFGYNDTSSLFDVYLYNTHQTESYSYQKTNEYNVNETVLLASYMLREKLKTYHINAYVETTNIGEILRVNNWKYKYSYSASRLLVEDFLKSNHPKLLIDIHRDSGSYEKTTFNYNDKSYAKLLFVVGKKNPNYQANYEISVKLNELIRNELPGISRGIILKDGNNVNGIYNQDLDSKIILIEIGGEYNTIAQVNNTLDLLSKVLYEYLNESSKEE